MSKASWTHRSITLAALLLVAGLVRPTAPATLVVDNDGTAPYASIQAAIDDAVPGVDDVLVRCGTYHENIVMRDGVSVSGERPACTFIDQAVINEPVVTMSSLGPDTILRGFTIHNRSDGHPSTTAIEVSAGSPVITRNVIQGPGPASNSGTGIYVGSGTPVISYNVIRGNDNCCYGGGIVLGYTTSAVVRSNLIVGNTAYYGAGIFADGGNPVIVDNTIVDNEGWLGGGLLVAGQGIVANNVIAFNTAVIYGGGVADWGLDTLFEANDVFGNQQDNYSTEDHTGTNGNISIDPLFVDRYDTNFAGFQPRSSSPLVDAGSTAWSSDLDLRGIARPLDGDVDGIATPDIGARENEGVTGLVHDGSVFVWDPVTLEAAEYHVYRGDLATLRQTGDYTQDPATIAGARHFCGVAGTLDDTDLPDPRRAFFYLPVAVGLIEGSLGFDSRPVERPKSIPCQ